MSEGSASAAGNQPIEDLLREDLARGDEALAGAGPILRHLLVNEDHVLFGDEIVARVRGIFGYLASELLHQGAADETQSRASELAPEKVDGLAAALALQQPLLTHVHATAIEWQLANQLHARLTADMVLSPMLQALVASADPELSSLAMSLLAAQARFGQAMRRMTLPLGELSGDLAQLAWNTRAAFLAERGEPGADAAARRTNELQSRLGLAARILRQVGAGAGEALSVTHAGTALFFSALSMVSAHDRDLAIFAAAEVHPARLALMLRAAGQKPDSVNLQLAAFHPDFVPHVDFERIDADQAAALIAQQSLPWGV